MVSGVVTEVTKGASVVTVGIVVGYFDKQVLQHLTGSSMQDFSDQLIQKKPISLQVAGVVASVISDVTTVVSGGASVVTVGIVVGYFDKQVLQHLTGFSIHDLSDQLMQKKPISSQVAGIIGGVGSGVTILVAGGASVVTVGIVVGYFDEQVLQHLTGSSMQDFFDQLMQKKPISSQVAGVVDSVVSGVTTVVTGGASVVTVGIVVGYFDKQVLQHLTGSSMQDFSDQVMQKNPISSQVAGVVGSLVSGVATVVTGGVGVVAGCSVVENFEVHERQHLTGFV